MKSRIDPSVSLAVKPTYMLSLQWRSVARCIVSKYTIRLLIIQYIEINGTRLLGKSYEIWTLIKHGSIKNYYLEEN